MVVLRVIAVTYERGTPVHVMLARSCWLGVFRGVVCAAANFYLERTHHVVLENLSSLTVGGGDRIHPENARKSG